MLLYFQESKIEIKIQSVQKDILIHWSLFGINRKLLRKRRPIRIYYIKNKFLVTQLI